MGCSGGVRWRMLWWGAYSEAFKEEYNFSHGEVSAKGFATEMSNCDPSRKSTRRALRTLRALRVLQASEPPQTQEEAYVSFMALAGNPCRRLWNAAKMGGPHCSSGLFWWVVSTKEIATKMKDVP